MFLGRSLVRSFNEDDNESHDFVLEVNITVGKGNLKHDIQLRISFYEQHCNECVAVKGKSNIYTSIRIIMYAAY